MAAALAASLVRGPAMPDMLTSCDRWHVRIVKPFHGRPTWTKVPSRSGNGEKELVVDGIDWDARWKEISDRIIEMSVDLVNGGYPYFCYKGK